MKKILILAFVCLFAFSAALPCVAADAEASPVTIGTWPQSRVTSAAEITALSAKLRATTVQWKSDILPNGDSVQYCDVGFLPFSDLASSRPFYRAVRIGSGAIQWYRWEPLTWEPVSYRGLTVLVCTSVVFNVQNDDERVETWLRDAFYRSALSVAEQKAWCICKPAHGITNDSVADVEAYAALYGADGSHYYQCADPEIPTSSQPELAAVSAAVTNKSCTAKLPAKTEKITPAPIGKQVCVSSAFIGVRPVLISSLETQGGGLINLLRRLLGL